ncbi:hypothetical protein MA16_Dca003771 [Dendrobium catenatum]|uniref:Chromo domain-containing protein n=1 Tax=Dendrobium catenatum TaxID=906689 RepID=A0A2I0WFZ5_9ASPA|nr:hypothetical protein MA16_Dca003771 [Dendrobium catenatum]
MSSRYRISKSASAFASHLHELHKDIAQQIEKNNQEYKLHADLKRRFKTFEVGDFVMVRIRPERFPPGTVKKLHAKSAGPFKILKKINDNAYIVDLPADFNINPSFNIEDLVAYEGPDFNPQNPLSKQPCVNPPCEIPNLPPLPNIPKFPMAEQVEAVLSDEIISTREGGRRRYLIRWKGKPESEDTWLDREELQQIDPDALEIYESARDSYSTESSFLPPRENDGDIRSSWKVYQRRGRRSTATIESNFFYL